VNLKAALERDVALLAAGHASFAEGQKVSIERKLNAVDGLWTKMAQLRGSLPPVLTLLDVVTVAEYRSLKNHPQFNTWTQQLTNDDILKLAQDPGETIEQVRPYIGEYMWAVFDSYQAIMLRVLVLMKMGLHDPPKLEWHKDSHTRQLISAVLKDTELSEFDQLQFGKVSWLQRRLEWKLLEAARDLISGKQFGEQSLEQARLIQERVAELRTVRPF
jgi:hypothetical protein